MEINSTSIFYYIKIFDEVLPEKTLDIFKKVCKEHFKYKPVGVVNSNKDGSKKVFDDKTIRNVTSCELKTLNEKSLTNIHWCSFLLERFKLCINTYIKEKISFGMNYTFENIDVLKYEVGGHYEMHWDHGKHTPRTLSIIFIVNEDYEGGDLIFSTPDKKHNLKIEKKKNILIVWPSDFLFPHMVTPVTKGTRYSVVSWAL